MARLFISHSSRNSDKAIEVRDWLAANGWDDVFLDLDPERGIVAGQRWKEALQKAAHRCEVVLALVSDEWLASGWCKSEIDAARLMGKKIIVALIGIDKSRVPLDLSDEQWVDLAGDPSAYRRLKEGLKSAGLDPSSFSLEPGRRPYPGFAFLEEKDAAVFFGRDAQIVRGLDKLRSMSRAGVERMLVILGASGSGKSSFLRAGLWPRLKRDDRSWLPLPTIRPERAVISGKYGLAQALQQTINDDQFANGIRQRGLPRSRADIQDFIENTKDGLVKLFAALRDIGQVPGLAGENTLPPTIILVVDQGEELFNEEGRDEAARFIAILTRSLQVDLRVLVLMAMRSDSCPLLQADPSLAALPKDTFTLDMMLEGSFRAVIEEPARLLKPTPLRIDPQLTDALLEDISGQDALPLLAFTLAHLYECYSADNELSLSGYDKLGRLKGVIDTTVKQAFAEGVAGGELPSDGKAQLALARAAFIPHLAQVNAARQFVRRVAPRNQIPAEARPLIDRFADQRLLIKDRRNDVEVVEVAHEALLRQPPFSEWLAEDRDFLVWRERLSQARAAFEANERGLLAGRELAIARGYLQTRAKDDVEPADQAFIHDSIAEDDKRRAEEEERERKRQVAEKEEQERRIQDAERIAAEQKKAAGAQKRVAQATLVGLAFALLAAAFAGWEYFGQVEATKLAKESQNESQTHLREALITQSRSLVDAAERNPDDQSTRILLALEALPDIHEQVRRPLVFAAQTSLSKGLDDQRELTVFGGHAGPVRAVAITPNGAGIVTGSDDMTARIWDAMTGSELLKLEGHAGPVQAVAITRDGTGVVTGSDDGTARLWNASTGGELLKLEGHTKAVNGVAVTPDGTRIVTASDDNSARVWDARSGAELLKLVGHTDAVQAVAITPDGGRIATASADATVRVWDARTGDALLKLEGHAGPVQAVAITPDGSRIVTGSADKTVRIWDAKSGAEVLKPMGHMDAVRTVAITLQGARIVTASDDFTVREWDARTGTELIKLAGHSGTVYGVAATPDGTRIITASGDSTARVWDARTAAELLKLDGHTEPIRSVAISPDGTGIVTGSDDGTARVWDAGTGAVMLKLEGHSGPVRAVAITPDGTVVITGSTDGTARLWNVRTGVELLKLVGHTKTVNGVAATTDGSRVATASSDNTARVWDATSGAELLRLAGHAGPVLAVATTPGGGRIVTASADKTVRVWDAKTGVELLKLEGHAAPVRSVAVTADGTRIVTGSSDRTARIWDANSGAELIKLEPHIAVNAVAITPDGTRVITGSTRSPARPWVAGIWDAKTGAELFQLRAGGSISSVAVTPDGANIVAVGSDHSARMWDIALLRRPPVPHQFSTPETRQAVIDYAKSVVPRCLTIEQRKMFLLRPRPPDWCIEMAKYPYGSKAWKASKTEKTVDAADSNNAAAFGDFADIALKAGDFRKALEAADLGIWFDPALIWVRINRAHALMFLDRIEEARDEYLAHRGAMVLDPPRLWEQAIVEDFPALREQGRDHPLMTEIEQLFKPSLPQPSLQGE